jgi:hypothetical protein
MRRIRAVALWVVIAFVASLLLMLQLWALPPPTAAMQAATEAAPEQQMEQIGGTTSWQAGRHEDIEVEAPSQSASPRNIQLHSQKAALPERTIDCPTYAGPMVHSAPLNSRPSGVTSPHG